MAPFAHTLLSQSGKLVAPLEHELVVQLLSEGVEAEQLPSHWIVPVFLSPQELAEEVQLDPWFPTHAALIVMLAQGPQLSFSLDSVITPVEAGLVLSTHKRADCTPTGENA